MRSASCLLGLLGLTVSILSAPAAWSQQINLDQGARVEGLWLFPSVHDPGEWYYVPSEVKLVEDEQGRPSFSFMRYVINRASAPSSTSGITEAEGGGILHFLVTYDTPEEERREAERALRKKTGNKEAKIRGPVLFKKGRYALVSSIINSDGDEEPKLLASGNAPVFEGSQVALSFDLAPDRATLLMESFKSTTPDVSLVFEMTMEGLSDAFDAELVVHWGKVYASDAWGFGGEVPPQVLYALTIPAGAAIGAGVGAYGAGVGASGGAAIGAMAGALVVPPVGVGGQGTGVFDQLLETQAIELRTRGENKNLEALIDKVYTTLLDLMFEQVEFSPGDEEDDEGGGIADLLGFGKGDDVSGRKPVMGVGVTAGWKRKSVTKTGSTVISMNHQESVERVTTIGFNAGDLWSRFGDDPEFFKTVNLADPAFQQREIHVGIDGAILPEFETYINSVTTILRKRHENGKTTVQEIVVDRDTFDQSKNDFRMIYGWNGDEDRTAWLAYDYRTRWSFKGGGVYETEWQRAEANMVDLYAPYRRKVIRVLGDHEYLAGQGIRAVIVQVDYPFFADRKKDQIRIRTNEAIEGLDMEITLPLDKKDYHYKITWIRSQGGRLVEEGTDSTGLLFVDEPPGPAPAPAGSL